MADSRKISDNTHMFYHQVLTSELAARSKKNSRYSLRAFAKFLEIDPGTLSRMLSGKEVISAQTAMKLSQKLKLKENDHRAFISSLLDARRKKEVEKIVEAAGNKPLRPPPVKLECHNLMAAAILELAALREIDNDPSWIAKRLRSSPEVISPLIAQLISRGALSENQGRLRKADQITTTSLNFETSESLREIQKEILRKAIEAIDTIPIQERGSFSMTFSIRPEAIPRIKTRMIQFLDDISDLYEVADATEVHQMSIQLFPMSFPIKDEEKS